MNQIELHVTVKRATPQRIEIGIGRGGEGDDIVAMWADQLEAAIRFASRATPAKDIIQESVSTDSPALHSAVRKGDRLTAITLLEDNPGSVNHQDDAGNTALHVATFIEAGEMVGFLLRSGANANVLNNDELAPLHVAARRGLSQIVELLLLYGANKNLPDGRGWTAYAWAKVGEHEQMAKLLKGRT